MQFLTFVAAFVLAVLAMHVLFLLVRLIADTVLALMALAAALVALGFSQESGITSWSLLILYSVIGGAGAGLLCIPLLPFSTWFKTEARKALPGSDGSDSK